jgi:hypothetical protein
MATTITLTAEPSGTPAPYVDVLASGFDVGISTTTIWRTAAGRTFRVRGLVNVSTGGTVTIRDFEAPLGVECSYRAEHFDSSGDFVSWSDSETVTLTEGDLEVAYLHNPFDPSTSVQVVMSVEAASTVVRPSNAEKFAVKGRSVPVIISQPRKGVEGVLLDFSTRTLAAAESVETILGGYDDDTVPIVCVRTHPNMLLPPTFFAYIDRPTKRQLNVRRDGEIIDWLMAADEVAPPVEAAITVLLDYADFTAFYTAGYDVFTAAYADYQEATRDYSIAGTA